MFRELNEEVGLKPCDVEVIEYAGWLKYEFPENLIRKDYFLLYRPKTMLVIR